MTKADPIAALTYFLAGTYAEDNVPTITFVGNPYGRPFYDLVVALGIDFGIGFDAYVDNNAVEASLRRVDPVAALTEFFVNTAATAEPPDKMVPHSYGERLRELADNLGVEYGSDRDTIGAALRHAFEECK